MWFNLQVLIAAVFIMGCNSGGTSGGTSIIAPSNNAVFTDYPDEFVVNYSGDDTEQIIKLNKITVTQFFTLADGVARADGEALQDFIKQGANSFSANSAKVNFALDNQGPLVLIEHVSDTAPFVIRGVLVDPAGAKSLQINDVEATIDGDQFEVTVDDSSLYQVLAVDNLDQSSEVTYAAPGTNMQEAIKVQIEESAIQTLAAPITGALQNISLGKSELNRILGGDPIAVVDNVRVSLTCKLTINVYLDQLGIGQVNVARLDVLDGGKLGSDISVNGISADISVSIDKHGFCILPYRDKFVGADLNSFSTSTDIGLFTQGGEVSASINIQDYEITGLNTRFSGLLAVLEAFDLFNVLDRVVERVANGLSPAVSKIASSLINKELSKHMTELVVEAQIKVNDEQGLAFKTQLMELDSDPGKLDVVLSGRLRADPVDNGVPNVLGSLYVGGPVPAPQVGEGNMAVLLGGDFISQALMAAYRAGFFNITMIEKQSLNQAELLFGTANQSSATGPEGKLRIRIRPLAGVPVFNFYGAQIAAANVNVHRMQVEVDRYANGRYLALFNTVLDFDAGIELALTDERAIKLNIVRDPVATLSALAILNHSIDTAFVNSVIGFVMPSIMRQIDRSLLTIELPTIGGYGITPIRIETLGSQHENLLFEGNIFGPGA